MSRRLRLARRDAQLHIEAVIQQRGFANIWASNNRDIAGFS